MTIPTVVIVVAYATTRVVGRSCCKVVGARGKRDEAIAKRSFLRMDGINSNVPIALYFLFYNLGMDQTWLSFLDRLAFRVHGCEKGRSLGSLH